MINLVFLGAPGSGKGTQARFIHKTYQLNLIGMGDLLREEIKQGTAVGQKIQHIIEAGGFPANDLVFDVLKAHLFSSSSQGKGYVFDGIPRDIDQARTLDGLLASLSLTLNKAIYLEVDENTLMHRILQRYMCVSCGAVYGKDENAPKQEGVCDWCGGTEFTRRKDDSEAIFLQRLALHKEKEGPVVEYYQQQGTLFSIDGTRDILLIQKQIQDLFKIMGG